MIGMALAVAFTLSMSLNFVIARRGVLRASAGYIANISIWSGPLFFLVICLATGELFNLRTFTWQAYVFFAISGLVHFVLGRTFGYSSIQLIGATRANVLTNMNGIVTVVLAVTVLHERLTPLMALGIVLSMIGPLLIAYKEHNVFSFRQSSLGAMAAAVDRSSLHKGILFGLGAALFWGASGVFIKLGLDNGGTSIVGSLIAYVAASLAILPYVLSPRVRADLRGGDSKSFQLALWSGMTTNAGQLFRFMALSYASLISVSLIMRTQPILVLLLSFIFNRKLESFSRWVLLGNALVLVGTILVVM